MKKTIPAPAALEVEILTEASAQKNIRQFLFQPYDSSSNQFKEVIPHDFSEGFASYLSKNQYAQMPSLYDFVTGWESETASSQFLLIFSFYDCTCALFLSTLDAYKRFQAQYGTFYQIMHRILLPEKPASVSGLQVVYPLVPSRRI